MPRAPKKTKAQTPLTPPVRDGESVARVVQPCVSDSDNAPATNVAPNAAHVTPTQRLRPTLVARDVNDRTCEWCNRTPPSMETVRVTVTYHSFNRQWAHDMWIHELCVLPFLKGYPETAIMLPACEPDTKSSKN